MSSFKVVNGKLTNVQWDDKGKLDCSNTPMLEDISDLPEEVIVINISNCSNVKVFPKHIKDKLCIIGASFDVLRRIKNDSHLTMGMLMMDDYSGFNSVVVYEN